ncbi:MAG: hypothetical protein E6G55_00525, partial [Actinobacteria bacterium]
MTGSMAKAWASTAVTDWLLEEHQPSIRYLALTQLLGRREDEPDVRAAHGAITKTGWAAEILAAQKSGGFWVDDESL